MQLDRALNISEKRRKETEAELEKSTRVNAHNAGLKSEVIEVHKTLKKMAEQIQDQLMPQTQTIMILKQHIYELYKMLGNSESKAWYHTLVEAGEYEALGPFVSGMLIEGQANQRMHKLDSMQDAPQFGERSGITSQARLQVPVESADEDDASGLGASH